MKSFLKLILMLTVLAAVFFCGTSIALIALKPRIDQQIEKIIGKTQGHSIEINFFDYGRVRLSGAGVAFKNIRVRGVTRIEHPYFDPRVFEITAERLWIGVRGRDLNPSILTCEAQGVEVKGGQLLHPDPNDHERLESVSKLSFSSNLFLGFNPKLWREKIFERALAWKAWAFEDQPVEGIRMHGTAVFLTDDWPISVAFHSVADAQGKVHLEANPEDMRVIAEMIETKFTETDLQVVSKNLLKAPRLLRIRNAAEQKAILLRNRDSEVQFDTIRHIYWSYWLTRAYGPEFALQATNAHEIGDLLSTPFESDKDRHHNALGIEYAKRGLTESEVERLIFSDPRVIRRKNKTKESPQAPPQKVPPAQTNLNTHLKPA